MKHYTAILTAGIGLTLSPMVQAKQKPNIVFIFADDLGWKDVGYNDNDYYETPVITSYSIHYTKLYDRQRARTHPGLVALVQHLEPASRRWVLHSVEVVFAAE